MGKKNISETADALIVFADIIDSSKYSSILGYKKYARRLLHFQEIFESLGNRYFPPVVDSVIEYSRVDAHGDEGIIFSLCKVDKEENKSSLIMRAIVFLFHLKAYLRFNLDDDEDEPPKSFSIGAGIHWGKVAIVVELENNRLLIQGIEGYAINFAKRVESCSREGKYSQIMLSCDAGKTLEFDPIIFNPINCTLKGIQNEIELLEVKSGLFDDLKIVDDNIYDQRIIDSIEEYCINSRNIDLDWLRVFSISILEYYFNRTPVHEEKKRYRELQYNLAWSRVKEEDPLFLYLRSRQCREKNEITRELKYLRSIYDLYPHCFFIKRLMVRAFWESYKKQSLKDEIVLARDIAKELLDKYIDVLSPEEVRQYNEIIKRIEQKKIRKTRLAVKKRKR